MAVQEADERIKLVKIQHNTFGSVFTDLVFYDKRYGYCDFPSGLTVSPDEEVVKKFDLEEAFQFLEDCEWEGKIKSEEI